VLRAAHPTITNVRFGQPKIAEQSPARERPLQYIADLQAKILNVRVGTDYGHPRKLLRYLPLKGRNTPDLPFIRRLANDRDAAEVVVPAQLIVIQ